MTPRVRGGRSGLTCGYCCVTERRSMVLSVTPSPFSSPTPGTLRFFASGAAAPGPTSCSVSMAITASPSPSSSQGDLHGRRHQDVHQRDRDQRDPREALELVLAQPRVGRPEPDDKEGERADIRAHPDPPGDDPP